MKNIGFIVLLFSSCIQGQNKNFAMSGHITDCRENYPVSNVEVKLVGSDGSSKTTITDSAGFYEFNDGFVNNTHYAICTHADANIGKGPPVKYGLCPFIEYDGHANYIDLKNQNSFHYVDNLEKTTGDICLEAGNSCVWITLPEFHFKKNSTDFEYINWIDSPKGHDTIVDCLIAALIARKTWVIEIGGHAAADEDKKDELAAARAKKIFDLLVSKGIQPERLKYKGYSDKQPFEYPDVHGAVLKASEELIYEKSRRVSLGVLRRDFESK